MQPLSKGQLIVSTDGIQETYQGFLKKDVALCFDYGMLPQSKTKFDHQSTFVLD